MDTKPTKPKLIMISDLWGIEKSKWITFYTRRLHKHFDISILDSILLAEINGQNLNEQDRHKLFITGGLEKATQNLLNKLPRENTYLLGFSIGGYIAWKACLAGISINYLFAISSTRLRLEEKHPNNPLKLFFDEMDPNIPKGSWFQQMAITPLLYKDIGHNFYMKEEAARAICNQIISTKCDNYAK